MAEAIYPDLRGEVAVFASGASGIGEAIVRALAAQGARVGFIDRDESAARRLEALWVTPEAEANLLAEQCPKRTLNPGDVARVVLFLASRAAAGCTAQAFVVDGGWM